MANFFRRKITLHRFSGIVYIFGRMKYCVIGLGIFGRHLCTHLASLGAEVLAIDPREENVAAVKDVVDAAVELDFTDPVPFAQFPVKEMDAVVIAIGDNFEASMMLTLRMQELGAKKLFVACFRPCTSVC